MARSEASTVEDYLDELPPERREVVRTLRDVIRARLPEGFVETMNWGMITYEVPLETYPDTYNGQPLMYAALAAQKQYYAVYLTTPYQDPETASWLEDRFREAGKKLDMGKSCLRFRTLDDVPLHVLGDAVARFSPTEFIERYEAARAT